MMKTKILLKKIDGVFIPPIKIRYFGKAVNGTPYFYPTKYNGTIISIRKLKVKDLNAKHNKDKFSNLPMVRRTKYFIKKVLGQWYYIAIGWPIKFGTSELGWKDKYGTPRFEWAPAKWIYFFGLEYHMWWMAPLVSKEKYRDNDTYYEQILWFLNYSNESIDKAKESWGWVDMDTKKSTWNDNYLVK